MQNAQRRASVGICDRHSGHARVTSATGASVRMCSISALSGRTIRKKMTAAMIRNETSALRKTP